MKGTAVGGSTSKNINKLSAAHDAAQSYHPPEDIQFLASTIETPFFLLDLHIIRQQLSKFQHFFPDTAIYYSTKTNSHPAVMSLVANRGLGFDVATMEEIRLALRNGASPEKLLYTHPVKSIDEIKKAYALGVRKFTLDSLDELKRHALYAPGAENYLRISPVSNASLYDYKYKFGVTTEELMTIMDHAIKHNIHIHGLSFMVGSQSMSLRPWLDMFERIIAIIDYYYDSMPTLRKINIGSGFPVQYRFEGVPQIEEIAAAVSRFKTMLPADIELMAEPGRFIAAPATTLATRVVQRINRNGKHWLYTDASAYSGLIEVIENGGHFPYPISGTKPRPNREFMIGGKTLDPDDILGKAVPLSDLTDSGDILYVHDVGAYNSSFFTEYHSLPHPRLVVHDSEYTSNITLGLGGMSINGIRARRDVEAGEVLFAITGTPAKRRTRTTFQTRHTTHVEPNLYGAFLNHSCDPNAGIRTNKATGHLEVITRHRIARGEEIVADYAMFEYETSAMAKVTCLCGSKLCRTYITGYKDLPPARRKAYAGLIADYLLITSN